MKKCTISGKLYPADEMYAAETIQPELRQLIQKDYPDFDKAASISFTELSPYRKKYLTHLIEEERGELDELEKDVVESISKRGLLTENVEEEIKDQITLGERMADRIAEFGGSWTFVISFFSFLFLWIVVNLFFLFGKPFDPFPFILLNLILSCLAAIQAPIIMMSQNRQESKDRIRSEHDYKVNLKAEMEIRLLHEKIDHLIARQNEKLIAIQKLQTDYLEDILRRLQN